MLSLGAKGAFGDWQDPKQSYLIQKGPLAFGSTYERVNGGTARHWLGTSLRFVPSDFEMKSRFDRFVDWPIKYDHLERWYGDAEKEIGVSANVEDQSYLGAKIQLEISDAENSPVSRRHGGRKAMSTLKVPGVGLDDLHGRFPALQPRATRSLIKTGAYAPATPTASRSAQFKQNTTRALLSRMRCGLETCRSGISTSPPR